MKLHGEENFKKSNNAYNIKMRQKLNKKAKEIKRDYIRLNVKKQLYSMIKDMPDNYYDSFAKIIDNLYNDNEFWKRMIK